MWQMRANAQRCWGAREPLGPGVPEGRPNPNHTHSPPPCSFIHSCAKGYADCYAAPFLQVLAVLQPNIKLSILAVLLLVRTVLQLLCGLEGVSLLSMCVPLTGECLMHAEAQCR